MTHLQYYCTVCSVFCILQPISHPTANMIKLDPTAFTYVCTKYSHMTMCMMDVTGTIWCCSTNLVTASWYSLTKYSTHKFLKFWQRQLHWFYQLSTTLHWHSKRKNLLTAAYQKTVFGSRHLRISNDKNDLGFTYKWRILHCGLQSVHKAISAFQINIACLDWHFS